MLALPESIAPPGAEVVFAAGAGMLWGRVSPLGACAASPKVRGAEASLVASEPAVQ